MHTPTPEQQAIIEAGRLRELLNYDPETGVFYWKQGRMQQQKAGTINSAGYVYIKIGGRSGKLLLAHRLAWLYVYDVWPGELDHIDGNPSNNAIRNLREVTRSENMFNSKVRHDSKTGYKGVSFNKRLGVYHAYIKIDYKRKHLGFFSDIEEAREAYEEAFNELALERSIQS